MKLKIPQKLPLRGSLNKITDYIGLVMNLVKIVFIVWFSVDMYIHFFSELFILIILYTGLFIERIVAIVQGLKWLDLTNRQKVWLILGTLLGNTFVLYLIMYPYDRQKNYIRRKVAITSMIGYILQLSILIYVMVKVFSARSTVQEKYSIVVKGIVTMGLCFLLTVLIVVDYIKEFWIIRPLEDHLLSPLQVIANKLSDIAIEESVEPKSTKSSDLDV